MFTNKNYRFLLKTIASAYRVERTFIAGDETFRAFDENNNVIAGMNYELANGMCFIHCNGARYTVVMADNSDAVTRALVQNLMCAFRRGAAISRINDRHKKWAVAWAGFFANMR